MKSPPLIRGADFTFALVVAACALFLLGLAALYVLVKFLA
jgi:hypothetical protein